jgi:aldehyde dehydrogenase (NAD+)
MTIAKEEIFGPVMSLMKYTTEEEVIARANDTDYGLAAGIITKNYTRAQKLIRSLRAGTVWVNTYDVFDAALPFGGFKASGIGRELGEAGLENYLEKKTVVMGDFN